MGAWCGAAAYFPSFFFAAVQSRAMIFYKSFRYGRDFHLPAREYGEGP